MSDTCPAFYNTAPSPSGPSGIHCDLKPDTDQHTTGYWGCFCVRTFCRPAVTLTVSINKTVSHREYNQPTKSISSLIHLLINELWRQHVLWGCVRLLCSCWPWGCHIWKVVPHPPVMNVWGPLMKNEQSTVWNQVQNHFNNKTVSVFISILLLRRSGGSLVVGIHPEAAVAPHDWALKQKRWQVRDHTCV